MESIIDSLIEKGVKVEILNMGRLDNSHIGKLIRTIFFAFAEFERDMIKERTQRGKEHAKRTDPYFKDGRRGYSSDRREEAYALLQSYPYSIVERKTGISKSTLQRIKKYYDAMKGGMT